jgi:hypothetical protein
VPRIIPQENLIASTNLEAKKRSNKEPKLQNLPSTPRAHLWYRDLPKILFPLNHTASTHATHRELALANKFQM